MPHLVPAPEVCQLPVHLVEGEPRVRDLDLAARLEFSDPYKLRKLVARHSASLAALGVLA